MVGKGWLSLCCRHCCCCCYSPLDVSSIWKLYVHWTSSSGLSAEEVGHDLEVMRSSPALGSTVSGESAQDSLSPSVPSPQINY